MKCACQSIGLISLANDFRISFKAQVMTDASAAIGIVQRKGLGKFRHVDVQWLWLRERMQNVTFKAAKVNGKEHAADLLTKHLSSEDMRKHLVKLGFELRSDRSDKSLKIGSLHNERGDHWTRGEQCVIMRHHQPRMKLYSPFQAAVSPSVSALTSTRVTHGTFEDTNESFLVQDNWVCRTQQWRNLWRKWPGRIVFIPKSDTIENNKCRALSCVMKG